MKKRTQRKPLIFDHEGSTFRTHALGFLEANEVLLKYLPTIVELTEDFDKGEEGELKEGSVDITSMLKKLPQDLITDVCKDLLHLTEFKNKEDDTYSVIDPEDFENLAECLAVVWEVFQFNYPDFFGKGQDTAQPTEVPQPAARPSLLDKVEKLKPRRKKI